MKTAEIRELTDEELQQRIEQLREEIFRLRFRSATTELESPIRLRTVRKDIARFLTIVRERELAAGGIR